MNFSKTVSAVIISAALLCVGVSADYIYGGRVEYGNSFPKLKPKENEIMLMSLEDNFYSELDACIKSRSKEGVYAGVVEGISQATGESNNDFCYRLAETEGYREIESEYMEFIYKNPQCLYAYTGYAYWYKCDTAANTTEIKVFPKYIENVTEEKATEAIEKAKSIVASLVTEDMTDAEKALVLHDYIVDSTTYNTPVAEIPSEEYISNDDWTNFTAYGPLMNGEAVCQGYTQAYNLLLNLCGIETRFVVNDKDKHGWSLVKIGGNWYHTDTTFDDPAGSKDYVYHNYFLLSDKAIIGTYGHSGTDNITETCNDDKYKNPLYCFNRADGVVKYQDGRFYANRYLLLKDNYGNLKDIYGLTKKYNMIYTVNGEKCSPLDYVSCTFDGADYAFSSPEEYNGIGADGFDAKISPLNTEYGYAEPVTTENLNGSQVYITGSNLDGKVFAVLYSGGRVAGVCTPEITRYDGFARCDLSFAGTGGAESAAIFMFDGASFAPVAKAIEIR